MAVCDYKRKKTTNNLKRIYNEKNNLHIEQLQDSIRVMPAKLWGYEQAVK